LTDIPAASGPHRDISVDIAKGIGIALMALGHTHACPPDTEFGRAIYSFHVPLFFLLSGFFLDLKRSFFARVTSRAGSLLKPYLVVLLVTLFLKILYGKLISGREVSLIDYIGGSFWGTGATIEWVPLWFLPHLFLGIVIAEALCRYWVDHQWSRLNLCIVSFMLFAFGIYFIDAFWIINPENRASIGSGFLPGLPWSVDLLPITVSLIVFGYLVRSHNLSAYLSKSSIVCSAIIFFALQYFFDDSLDFNIRRFDGFLVTFLQMVTGCILVLGISQYLRYSRFLGSALAALGAASLIVLIFHTWFQGAAFRLGGLLTNNLLVLSLGSWIFGLLGSYLIWVLVSGNRALSALLLRSRARAVGVALKTSGEVT
jgi:polysaccharide biosynthesis protein PslL